MVHIHLSPIINNLEFQNETDILKKIFSFFKIDLIIYSKMLAELDPIEYDALIVTDDKSKKIDTTKEIKINDTISLLIENFSSNSKPIAALGLGAFTVAYVLKKKNPLITLGEQSELILNLKKYNIQHESCPADDYITDRDCKILSTPQYLDPQSDFKKNEKGLTLLIKELYEMS